MERYAAGDDCAFAAVYDGVAPRVYALALRALGDAGLAEDVVQRTLLNIHRARGAFVRGAEVMPWAYAIARRLIVDTARRRARERRLAEVAPAPMAPAPPDAGIAAAETAASLALAFAALPETQRTALDLRGRGVPLAVSAQAQGTTVTAVKLRLHRAVGSLRAALRAREPHE